MKAKFFQAIGPALFSWILGYKYRGIWSPRYDEKGEIYMWLRDEK